MTTFTHRTRTRAARFTGFILACAAALLTACGDKADPKSPPVRNKDLPFERLSLRNASRPQGGHPASAQASGRFEGGPGQSHSVGPVAPGGSAASAPGTAPADTVTLTVTFDGGATLRGSASYVGAYIGTIDIDCSEPSSATATVNFADGHPTQTIPMAP